MNQGPGVCQNPVFSSKPPPLFPPPPPKKKKKKLEWLMNADLYATQAIMGEIIELLKPDNGTK